MIEDKFALHNFPHLRGYMQSIGAEQLNFRRYLVKEYKENNYYKEKSYITITEEGDIICDDQYRPTEHVSNLIKQEISNVKDWPRVMAFSERQIKELMPELEGNQGVFRFYLRGSKLERARKKHSLDPDSNMIMLQVRFPDGHGGKVYKPYSYYSDGKWRILECDEKLPFFKPQTKTIENAAAKIMLHEGAKSAAAAQKIVEDFRAGKSNHPWAKELAEYEHWGIIGGALATQRSDYTELHEEKAREVIYMCDNDDDGKNSVVTVSQMYSRRMSVIEFDKNWKHAWDIAEAMPEHFFKNDKYTGPSLNSLIHPATWATVEIPSPEQSRKKNYDLTDDFCASWAFCIKPKIFINVDKPSQFYNEEEFNDMVRSFSHVKKTSELLVTRFKSRVDEVMYDPGRPFGIFNVGTNRMDSRIKFNMHVPATIPPVNGSPTMWLQYLEHMFPEPEDRYQVQRWIATLICRPDIKMGYAMLLISEQQGVGKSTLATYILAPLLGENNVSFPEENVIVESRFNSWQCRKRLAVVNEIYAGHNYKAYNRLKSVITEPTITVEEKYQTNYEIANWCHIFACSNDERAIKFSMEDRRWLVPQVTEKVWGQPNWKRFHAWLQADGLGIIKQWAMDFINKDEANIVLAGEESPTTRRKKAVFETMLSDGERLVLDRLSAIKERMVDEGGEPLPWFVVLHDLRRLIKAELYPSRNDLTNVESAYRLKKLLRASKYYASNSRVSCPNGIISEVIGNFKKPLEGKYSEIAAQMTRIPLESDDPRVVSLQGCV